MLKRLIDKVLSARWILTIIAGVVFAYCAVTKQLEAATITVILTMIFKDYFSRGDRNGTDRKSEGSDKTKSV